MAHRPTLEHWLAQLRPLFPNHAEVDVRPGLGQMQAKWPPRSAVSIFFAPNAVKDYAAACNADRARADNNLCEFVRENLRGFDPAQAGAYRIVVASIDFIPLRAAQ